MFRWADSAGLPVMKLSYGDIAERQHVIAGAKLGKGPLLTNINVHILHVHAH